MIVCVICYVVWVIKIRVGIGVWAYIIIGVLVRVLVVVKGIIGAKFAKWVRG